MLTLFFSGSPHISKNIYSINLLKTHQKQKKKTSQRKWVSCLGIDDCFHLGVGRMQVSPHWNPRNYLALCTYTFPTFRVYFHLWCPLATLPSLFFFCRCAGLFIFCKTSSLNTKQNSRHVKLIFIHFICNTRKSKPSYWKYHPDFPFISYVFFSFFFGVVPSFAWLSSKWAWPPWNQSAR